jgi:hypothetical protein
MKDMVQTKTYGIKPIKCPLKIDFEASSEFLELLYHSTRYKEVTKHNIYQVLFIIGSTGLHEPWPSSKALSTLPYLMPNSPNSSLLKS